CKSRRRRQYQVLRIGSLPEMDREVSRHCLPEGPAIENGRAWVGTWLIFLHLRPTKSFGKQSCLKPSTLRVVWIEPTTARRKIGQEVRASTCSKGRLRNPLDHEERVWSSI